MMLTDLDMQGESKTPSGINVHLIESDDITYVWDDILPLIRVSLRYAEGELEPEDLVLHLDTGQMNLWVAMEKNEVIAAMITEIITTPEKEY